MKKIALGIEYDGSAFHGWQRQRDVYSIQETLETALSKVAAHPVETVAAGRTDAKVHALGQVVHFECHTERTERAWVFGANTELPPSVRVLWAKEVPSHFNARYSALARRYRYIIYNHPIRPCLYRNQVGWYYKKLDIHKMRVAASHWLGEHDFSSFRASQCQSKTPVRNVIEINIQEKEQDWIMIEIEANAFLHHMVRNMVGALWHIGSGEYEPDWAHELLLARDRRLAGITAPPQGLYLMAVMYPEEFELTRYN